MQKKKQKKNLKNNLKFSGFELERKTIPNEHTRHTDNKTKIISRKEAKQ